MSRDPEDDGIEVVHVAPVEVAVAFFDDVDPEASTLYVSREPNGDVHLLHDPCGPEVSIPPGMWDRLFSLPPRVVQALRAAAGPWPPPTADDAEGCEPLRFTFNAPAEGECRVVITDDAVILEPHPALIAAEEGSCACGLAEIALVVGLDVALEATTDPSRFRVRFYEGGRLAGELVDVPPGLLTATRPAV